MSQDLLSFIDEPVPNTDHPPGRSKLGLRGLDHPVTHSPVTASIPTHASPAFDPNSTNEEDDDFGDFEDASPGPVSVQATPTQIRVTELAKPEPPKSYPPPKQTRSPFPPKAEPVANVKPANRASPPKKKNNVGSHPFAGRMDLLFEMDDNDYDAGADELGDLANNPEAAMAFSKRLIAEQEESAKGKGKGKVPVGQRGGFVDLEEAKQQGGGSAGQALARARDPNVLFDADDVSDHGTADGGDDDFGDFETEDASAQSMTAVGAAQTNPPTSQLDLLGLDEGPPAQPVAKSAQTRTPPEKHKPSPARAHSEASRATATALTQDEDFWEDFETTTKQQPAAVQPSASDDWPDFDDTPPPASQKPPSTQPPKPQPKKPNQLPPTNIPTPATLLTLYPSLFTSATETLLTPASKLDLKSRQTLLSHPATHQFLRAYLSALTVLARIVAGRKLRWKRDQRLTQSMRIGPSAAGGGKGGMKLAGLDRSEVAKEEREVLDTIRLYRAQIGKLRSAVTAASAAPGLPKLPAVPEIQETMPVKALGQVEGGVTAREACALCGLKREERVAKVDDGVQDSFGEWWVQGMSMHVQCKEFWEGHEGKLKSR